MPGAREGPHPSGDDSRSDLPAAAASLPFPSLKARGRLKTCLLLLWLWLLDFPGWKTLPPPPPSFNFGVEPPSPASPGLRWKGEVRVLAGGARLCRGGIPNATSGARGLAEGEGEGRWALGSGRGAPGMTLGQSALSAQPTSQGGCAESPVSLRKIVFHILHPSENKRDAGAG